MLTLEQAPAVPAELLAKYETAGPRYTSYPTVPAWSRDFGSAEYRRALDAAGRNGIPIALYAHFPYCAAKCFYCGCNALTTSRSGTIDRYLDDLGRELDLVADALGSRQVVAQMHWGGGTPNHLGDEQLARAYGLVAERFHIAVDAELSVEADPRLVTRAQLETLAHLGFRRISFGVQDLDAGVQEAIGRRQPFEQVRAACDAARTAGFTGLNLDLIYGLPRQTPATFARTIAQALELSPDRVACFGYAHLPAQRAHQRVINEAELPDGSTRAALFQRAVGAFTAAGYAWIGLDHFATAGDALAIAQRDGRLHRNFMGYTTMPTSQLLGVGMSAISDLGGCLAQNDAALGAWRARVHAGDLATVRGHRLTTDDLERKEAILQLMCNLQLPQHMVPSSVTDLHARMAGFERDGLLELGPTGLSVTPLGRHFVRNMAMELDAYLPAQQGQARFSRTV